MPDDTLKILGPDGRPVRRSELKKKQMATPTVTGVRSTTRSRIADDLTPTVLAKILRAIDQGDIRAYLELAEAMEEREPQYRTVLYTRKIAVSSLELKVKPASDEPSDEELAAEVLSVFVEAGAQDILEDMLDALGKGFSVHELVWDTKSTPWVPSFEYVDPRWFQFSGPKRRDLRLRDESDQQNGVELPPYRFLVHQARGKSGHPIRAGLARLVATSYMAKAFTLKDWLAFAEVYGMPLRVGKYAATLDESTPEGARDLAALIDAVANIGSDAAAVISEDMAIEFITTPRVGGGGDQVFRSLAEYIDKQISKAVLGQTMTTDDGSSRSQSETHNDVRHDYRNADVRRLMSDLHRDYTVPYVNLNYGIPDSGYPRIYLDTAEPEDLESLSKATAPFIDRGLQVPEVWVRSKFGIPDVEEGAAVLRPKSGGGAKAAQDDAPELDDEDEDDEATKRQKAARRRARVAFAAAKKGAKADVLDVLAETALAQMNTSPVLSPVRELAREAGDYAEFRVRLPEVLEEMDITEFGEDLAVALFEARGLGDASDSVKP